jgi:hypothetical protein
MPVDQSVMQDHKEASGKKPVAQQYLINLFFCQLTSIKTSNVLCYIYENVMFSINKCFSKDTTAYTTHTQRKCQRKNVPSVPTQRLNGKFPNDFPLQTTLSKADTHIHAYFNRKTNRNYLTFVYLHIQKQHAVHKRTISHSEWK